MKVQEVRLEDNFGVTKRRYILLNLDNQPIVPVIKYLKYLDNLGKAENTLKSCLKFTSKCLSSNK
ncbi:hypothetical protein EX87_19935 (plasmid) [Brevibacillus laterosporus]|uniref:Uncharacterized protein n=1 Tax=Brevibacillus laterosporus TaxID=1465 RepID=A0A0F7EJV4_BRELA|nr:hypothetical protein EX87_19935 [Brevibacillus laterosporus]